MRKLYASAFVIVAVACGSDTGGGDIMGTGAVTGTGGVGNTGGDAGTGGGIVVGGSGGGLNIGGGVNDSGPDAPTGCTPGTKSCSGQVPQFCEADGKWSQGTQCAFACKDGDCYGSCAPGTDQCKLGKTQTCGTDAEWGPKTACQFGCDSATGKCKTACVAGEFNCAGNTVEQCDPGPPAKWVPKSPSTVCSGTNKCDAKTGTCVACPIVGSATPTGEYYQYAIFNTSGGIFKGGYDVASYGDYIYVSRSSAYIDVYKVTLLDSDGDGKLEPNQHPSNPKETGPVEQRQLTFEKSIAKAAPDNAPVGPGSVTSLRALSNTEIHSLGPTKNGGIRLYDFTSKATTNVLTPAAATLMPSFYGYGSDEKVWYGANESGRRVYSFHDPSKAWGVEFCYPDLAGSHMDGMDVVVSPKTGIQYVYVSDMTSDFIGQYVRDDTAASGWKQEGLYKYTDATSSAVEGFTFGALKHFWATGGSTLIEIGGGDIQEDLEPCPLGKQACGGNLPACASGEICVGGCCSTNPCTNGQQYCGGGQACPAGQLCQGSCCVSQCPVGKQACGTGLPPCPTGNACQAGCCVQIG